MKPIVLFILIMTLCVSASGETPVSFVDANLKAAVETALGVTDPTPTDMLSLTSLNAIHLEITSLTGLEYGVNLTRLNLYDNQISQLSPLANLTKLTYLDLDDNQISNLSPLIGLTQLRHLDLDDNQITNISALSHLTGLVTLYLEDNQIYNISALSNLRLSTLSLDDNQLISLTPIAGITSLRELYCESNGLRDISALGALTLLQHLDLHDNQISDISSLSNLSNLNYVYLYYNQITCIQPLTVLTHLNQLDMSSNPLNRSAYSRHLLQILDNNPNVNLIYDPDPLPELDKDPCEPMLILSSTVGGRVSLPHEGTYFACPGESVTIQAEAASDLFMFNGWSGTAVDNNKVADPNQSSTLVTVDAAYTLKAHFESTLDTLIVESSGDPNGDGTAAHPLETIQDAIDVAGDGTRIIIRAGIYHEILNLDSPSVTLTGEWLIDPNVTTLSTVDGNGIGPVVTVIGGQDCNYVVEGVRIAGGRAQTHAAIQCVQSNLTLSHCVINGNRAIDVSGDILSFDDSQVTLEHCIITGNRTVSDAIIIGQVSGTLVVNHSIIWNNIAGLFNTLDIHTVMPEIQYSVVEGGWPGVGVLNVDPLFSDDGAWNDNDTSDIDSDDIWQEGDYHLKSQAGRYSPMNLVWEIDNVTSPCIDAGNPFLPWLYETTPHGSRINIGLYGGTSQASLSEEPY